jgi:hypothetical protein
LKASDPSVKGETNKEIEALQKIEWLDNKTANFRGWEYLKTMEDMQTLEKDASSSQDVATIRVTSDHPIGIVHSADWHLGSMHTSTTEWIRDFKYLLRQDDLYLVSLGDEVDMMQTFRVASARAQLLGVSRQEDLLKWVFDELVDNQKILCAGFGNHDTEFAERCWGSSYSKRVKSDRIPYFNGMGQLILHVGDQTYRGAMVHKTRFHSFLNALHGNIRLQQLHFPHAHWIATAHTHNPAYGCFQAFPEAREAGLDFGGDQMLIKCGTYKVDDPYSKRYYGKGTIGNPTLVLHPNSNKQLVFGHPQDAVTYIRGWKASNRKRK